MKLLQPGLTFDDVLLQPKFSNVLPDQTKLATKLSDKITLNVPVLSAAMDTVTELDMAIAMAEIGGMGIIHKNMSIEEQAAQVAQVKKFESGIVSNPITVSPNTTIEEVRALAAKHHVSGMPVVDHNKVVGIVTNRDIRFEQNPQKLVSELMTPKDKLITA